MNTPDFRIEIVVRDQLGSIVALITESGAVDASTASAEIRQGLARYVAGPDSYLRRPVKAMPGIGGGYLYVNWDGSRRNNLHDLSAGHIAIRRRPATPLREESATPTPASRARPARLLASIRRALSRQPGRNSCLPPCPAGC